MEENFQKMLAAFPKDNAPGGASRSKRFRPGPSSESKSPFLNFYFYSKHFTLPS